MYSEKHHYFIMACLPIWNIAGLGTEAFFRKERNGKESVNFPFYFTHTFVLLAQHLQNPIKG